MRRSRSSATIRGNGLATLVDNPSVEQALGHHGRDRRLADAAGPRNGDAAPGRNLKRELGGGRLAADDLRQRRRQVRQPCRLRLVRRLLDRRDRGDEAIAAPHDVDDITLAGLPVAEHLAQRRDMDAQIGLVHERVRPGTRQEFPFADGLARALDQADQDVERPAAQAAFDIALQQHESVPQQTERPEGDRR
jgi:hypothetical protein